MHITGTHFNYYFVCHCKLWLFANGIRMEQTSDLVFEGKLIHESSYPQRSERYQEVEMDGVKIDYYDPKNKIIHEVKKSDKHEKAHEWQLKYYIYILQNNGIDDVKGILEYPAIRKTQEVLLSKLDKQQIEDFIIEIDKIIKNKTCPPRVKIGSCKKCSYFDFCWSGEE